MSIYVDDPDGYHIELTVVFEDQDVGRREIEKRGVVTRRPRLVRGTSAVVSNVSGRCADEELGKE